jgi:3-oxoacyl-[acyl-carrier protein] reductase
MTDWTRRRVLVIAAGSGMGAAIVDRFRSRGAQVAAADLDSRAWREADLANLPIDVTDADSVAAALVAAETRFGGLDVVVNCAGILGPVEPTHLADPATFRRIVEVDLVGAFQVTRAAIPRLLESPSGRLIHIASIAGKEGNPQMGAYSAAKAGVIGLVKAVGREYAATSLTVNAIAPASIDTPLLLGMSEERRAVQRELIPMGRLGTVEEAAGLVEFVASEDASFTTGFVYDLSGGRATY